MEMEVLEMCEDQQMDALRAVFLKTGKGRRPALPHIDVTNKLFIQLYQLRFEAKVTEAEVEKWFSKLGPKSSYPVNRIWRKIERTVKAVRGRRDGQLRDFLSEIVDLDFISSRLSEVGITRALNPNQYIKCRPTNGQVIDLGQYLLKEGHSFPYFLKVLKDLSSQPVDFSPRELRRHYTQAEKKYGLLSKNSGRNREKINAWYQELFPPLIQQQSEKDIASTLLPPPQCSVADWPSLLPSTTEQQVVSSPVPWPSPPCVSTQEPSLSTPAMAPSANLSAASKSSSLSSSALQPSSSPLPVSTPQCIVSPKSDLKPTLQSSVTDSDLPSLPPSRPTEPQVVSPARCPSPPPVSTQESPSPSLSSGLPLPPSSPASEEASISPSQPSSPPVKSALQPSSSLQPSTVTAQVRTLKKENYELQRQIKEYRRTKTYKNNCALKKRCTNLKTVVAELRSECKRLREELDAEKKKKLCAQKNLSKAKKKLQQVKGRSESLQYTLNMINNLETEKKLELKDPRYNKFKDSVRITYMALQGEANVAGANCSKVVQIVAQHLFNQSLSLKDLPSTSSALSMMYEGNHIAKYQVVDEVQEADNFTFASDGTSRQKQHYIERHLVLKSGKSISLGFSKISSDDANSMLEQTICIFQDFINVYGKDMDEDEKNEVLKDVVSKMNCLMSDRAANMKLLNSKIHEWRKQVLNSEDIDTHFLYCNAHFLLGLCSATEKAISSVEGKLIVEGSLLGRDTLDKFKNFSSSKEAAAFRLIRTAAEVLGPRGDEKSGAREEWLVYCEDVNIASKFTSYRANRFNNVFDNAFAVLFHHSHVLDFLTNNCSSDNLKLQSIVADLKDPKIVSLVGAIALFNFTITGPYWSLMNSTVPYGSFPQYVKKIQSSFLMYVNYSMSSIDVLVPVFEDFSVPDINPINLIHEKCSIDLVISTFKAIVCESSKVLERQLVDFLDGGVFGGDISDDVQQILNTCPLTNLIGERLFGDLDYDMHKRRRASLHLRSTLNMWKHNDTIQWFTNLNAKKQTSILEAARKNSENLLNESRNYESQVKEKLKVKLHDNKRKRNEKDLKEKEKKVAILDAIVSHGGVCKTKKDLDILYKNGKAESLRDQIRYRKIFYGEKHLKVGGTVKELYKSLLQQIEEENDIISESKRRCPSSDEDE